MSDEVIAHIRGRIEKCRRLADMILDKEAAAALRQMADEGEADIQRLLAAKQDAQPDPISEVPPSASPENPAT